MISYFGNVGVDITEEHGAGNRAAQLSCTCQKVNGLKMATH